MTCSTEITARYGKAQHFYSYKDRQRQFSELSTDIREEQGIIGNKIACIEREEKKENIITDNKNRTNNVVKIS